MLNAQRAADRGPIRSQIYFRTSHDDGLTEMEQSSSYDPLSLRISERSAGPIVGALECREWGL